MVIDKIANIERMGTGDRRVYPRRQPLTLPQSRVPFAPPSGVGIKLTSDVLLICLPYLLMSALDSTTLSSIAGGDNQFVAGVVGAAAILATTVAYYAFNSKDEEHEFPKLRGIQIYHAWNFFQRRFDFLQSNFNRNRGKSFSFKVLHHTVVALAGEEARQAFFSDPHLGFNEGYMILMGAVRVSRSR